MAFKLTNTPFPLKDGKSRERKNQEAASRAGNLSLPQAKSIKQINKDPNIKQHAYLFGNPKLRIGSFKKSSPKKLFGGGRGTGYGTRPGERVGGKASAKADERRKKVDQRRGVTGLSSKEKVKIPTLFGKSTQGKNVGGEYKMGLADYKIFGGMGKKNLRARGLALEGDRQKHIDKKRRKKKRQIRRGAKFDNYGDRIA
jgi:hypothetical protein